MRLSSTLFFIIGWIVINGCTQQTFKDDNWISLFDGKTLDGWFLVHGDKPFEVLDGEIIGRTQAGITTRYLTTKQQYDDFILELEMYNQYGANSGVQFRSVTTAPFYAGLTGYQLEVDPSVRAWTGGIYFEGVGEWRHPPIKNQACVNAWHSDMWNTLRIEARGYQMRTFVNGVSCAYLFDQYLTRGHIGLQIHSVGNDPKQSGLETRWRNIRIKTQPSDNDYTPDNLKADSRSHLIDTLSPIEKFQGWKLVRDQDNQKDKDWKKTTLTNPIDQNNWQVNTLELAAGDTVNLLDISPNMKDFHLIGNFQMEAGTQGEITYPIISSNADGSIISCKASYSITDDRVIKPLGKHNHRLMGDLSNYISAQNLSEPNNKKRILFEKSWRWLGIKIASGHIEHWLNGVKVIDYDFEHNFAEKKGCIRHTPQDTTSTTSNNFKVNIRITKGKLIFRNLKFITDKHP